MSPILVVLLNLIQFVNRGAVPPTLNVKPTLFVIYCRGIWVYNVAILVSYQVNFHPNFNHPWQWFITSCRQENVGFWPMVELIHHSWWYLQTYSWEVSSKSYHSDIKYHMTPNVIFNVVKLEMNRLSVISNRLKFKTPRKIKLPLSLEDSIVYCTSNQYNKTERSQHVTGWD